MLRRARLAARWIRRRLNGRPEGASGRYVPDLSGTALLDLLAGGETGTATSRIDQQHTAVLNARKLFGRRFFADPNDVPRLWEEILGQHPDWAARQKKATETDANLGLPIYSTRGPRLGVGFPWDELPLGPGGDSLYAKRPHRFAFAPRSGLACLYDSGARARLYAMLDSWSKCATSGTNRYCYDSNLGVIQRLLASSWCWAFLASRDHPGAEHVELEWLVLRIIHADVRFLEPRLGHSAPNNHLLADRFAGWYLRTVFPELLSSSEGDEQAVWRDELLAQTYPDGGGFEHSAHYHEFACEMGAAYLLLCRRRGITPDLQVEARVEALLRFQVALTGPEAVPLPLGNGVEDTLFPLDPSEGWCPGSLRELYRALFRPDMSPGPADNADVARAFWLLGGALATSPAAPEPEADMRCFPDAGLFVQTDPALEARLTFRTGPAPGVAVVPGHMHADLLSIYLSVHGCPILVDSGTYTYRAPQEPWEADAPPWRPYFAGPAAHNGLVIEGQDPLGMIRRDFRGTGEEVRVIGGHQVGDGLDMIHARLVGGGGYEGATRTCVHVHGAYWLILDQLPENLSPDVRAWYGFQFGADCEVSIGGQGTTIALPGDTRELTLTSFGLDKPVLLEGSTDPLGGWVSPRYGELLSAPQLRFSPSPGAGSTAFLINVSHPAEDLPQPDVRVLESGAAITHVRSMKYEDLILWRGPGSAEGRIEWGGLAFTGCLLWIRVIDGRSSALRWIDADHFIWERHGLDFKLDESGRRSLLDA